MARRVLTMQVGQIPPAKTPQNQRGNSMYKSGKLHGSGMMGSSEKDSGKKVFRGQPYDNEVDEPKHQKIDHRQISAAADLGMMKCCADFKAEASDQAWGQSGKDGLISDEKKIHSQFFHAYSDDTGF